MALNLVTGYKGRDHITAEQWADFNRGRVIYHRRITQLGRELILGLFSGNVIV